MFTEYVTAALVFTNKSLRLEKQGETLTSSDDEIKINSLLVYIKNLIIIIHVSMLT